MKYGKKRRCKRFLAAVMSFIMAITLLFTNGTMVKADGGQKSINFTKRESNGVTGTISYKSDGDWVEITEWKNGSFTLPLDASVMSVAIKAVPSEGGYINQSNSRIGDSNIYNQDS